MDLQPLGVAALALSHATHPGLIRKTNEDCFGGSPAQGAFVVCDGMGGAAAGEVASHLACETFLEQIASTSQPPARRLAEAVHAANLAVFRRARATPGLEGMGTTLVAALFEPATPLAPGHERKAASPTGTLWIAHVGDSRCYLLRDGRLSLLTIDHSIVEQQIQAGLITRVEAEVSPVRHVITRAIGSQAQVEPDILPVDACPGDLFLLASDGLNRELCDDEIHRLLSALPPENGQHELNAACLALVNAANSYGGRDNVTVMLLHVSQATQESA